ncbi:MAG: hypothetical protein F6K22_23485 [Okeania sp. SIO2F4]|uniref:hypothetical protein n=1 Tax=Okeania sp. SIO2F4 TaxID=2607790 RepID=UPI00142912BA|nr:hypothetical protein [Okeania sp. SIO2F4]NES05513.1 hypothetical protein [Okeania sp. SIO2F4]
MSIYCFSFGIDSFTNLDELFWPAINDNGQVVFIARGADDQTGIYTNIIDTPRTKVASIRD